MREGDRYRFSLVISIKSASVTTATGIILYGVTTIVAVLDADTLAAKAMTKARASTKPIILFTFIPP